jgi:hypothetical protein
LIPETGTSHTIKNGGLSVLLCRKDHGDVFGETPNTAPETGALPKRLPPVGEGSDRMHARARALPKTGVGCCVRSQYQERFHRARPRLRDPRKHVTWR